MFYNFFTYFASIAAVQERLAKAHASQCGKECIFFYYLVVGILKSMPFYFLCRILHSRVSEFVKCVYQLKLTFQTYCHSFVMSMYTLLRSNPNELPSMEEVMESFQGNIFSSLLFYTFDLKKNIFYFSIRESLPVYWLSTYFNG